VSGSDLVWWLRLAGSEAMGRRGGGGSSAPSTSASAAQTQPPVSLAAIRKQRERQQALAGRIGAGLVAGLALGAALLGAVRGRGSPEAHPQHTEAVRILRNDGLEASEGNVRAALRLVDAATQPYDDRRFRTVDPSDWAPRCTAMRRACGRRPEVAETRRDEKGHEVRLLGLASGDANVWLVEDFVSEEDAERLLDAAHDANFSTSPTQRSEGQDWRSSSSALLPRGSPAAHRVAERAAAVCGVPVSFVEDLQVVRYRPGERYQPHLDSEGPDHRHWTLLLYLNDPGSGGATGFPLMGLKVMPSPRAALLWENLRPEPDMPRPVRNYNTLHDGQAPTGREPKYAVNVWVRNAEYVGLGTA